MSLSINAVNRLGTGEFPDISTNSTLLQQVQASKTMSITLQAELTNALSGRESLANLQSDLTGLPVPDQATVPGDVDLVAQVVTVVTAAQNPVGAQLPNGQFGIGLGFLSLAKQPNFDPSVDINGYRLNWDGNQLTWIKD